MLLRIEGVTSVTSGYMGGEVDNPTYKQACDLRIRVFALACVPGVCVHLVISQGNWEGQLGGAIARLKHRLVTKRGCLNQHL